MAAHRKHLIPRKPKPLAQSRTKHFRLSNLAHCLVSAKNCMHGRAIEWLSKLGMQAVIKSSLYSGWDIYMSDSSDGEGLVVRGPNGNPAGIASNDWHFWRI
jgi:hypothetical protein